MPKTGRHYRVLKLLPVRQESLLIYYRLNLSICFSLRLSLLRLSSVWFSALLLSIQSGAEVHQVPDQTKSIQVKKMTSLATRIIDKYKVKAFGEFSAAESLSGGNLQKFIIGREIEQQPKLLLASHPTWGVDIGAQVAIHEAIIKLRDNGSAILVVSEDLDELFQISDRLCAICDGELSPIKETNQVSLETIGCWMAGEFDVESENSPLINKKEITNVAP